MDLSITQGSSFSAQIQATGDGGSAFNLSGYNVRGYSKYRYSDTGVLLDLQPSIVSPASGGLIQVSIGSSGTANLPVCQAHYDIEVYSGDYSFKAAAGLINVYPEVTS